SLVLAAGLAPMMAQAAAVQEHPTGGAMIGDVLVARPLGLVFFAVGSVVYLATLPISLAGGNAGEAGDKLVLQPAKEVFVRCLGCTRGGYKETLVN
ncbi:MAG: hypothetical protein ACI9YG_000205, partial [Candidatus Azotimanducaceae bacterium]